MRLVVLAAQTQETAILTAAVVAMPPQITAAVVVVEPQTGAERPMLVAPVSSSLAISPVL